MPNLPPAHNPPAYKHGWERQQRGRTPAERGYGYKWHKLRKMILARDCHLCQPCLRKDKLTTAQAVDHIKPKAQGGTDEHSNLQSICNKCHNAKTSMETL